MKSPAAERCRTKTPTIIIKTQVSRRHRRWSNIYFQIHQPTKCRCCSTDTDGWVPVQNRIIHDAVRTKKTKNKIEIGKLVECCARAPTMIFDCSTLCVHVVRAWLNLFFRSFSTNMNGYVSRLLCCRCTVDCRLWKQSNTESNRIIPDLPKDGTSFTCLLMVASLVYEF